MPDLEMLRVFVNERLTVAAEEIFGLFARTVAEYEDKLYRWKQENERQITLLDSVLNPDVRLNRIALSVGVQLDVEPPNSKNEQDPLWSSQEEKHLALIPEKSVDDDNKAQSSLLEGDRGREPSITSLAQQRETKKENEDDGGPEPGSNLVLETFLQPANDTKAVDNNDVDCNQHTEPEAQTKTGQRKLISTSKLVSSPEGSQEGYMFCHLVGVWWCVYFLDL